MIITLTGATFSTSIGTLDSWFIQTSITGGGLTASESNIKSIRKDDTAGATLTYTYDTENYKYTNGTVTDATGATVGSISGSNGTVTVTLNAGNTIKGKITIAILMEYIGSGEEPENPVNPPSGGITNYALPYTSWNWVSGFGDALTRTADSFSWTVPEGTAVVLGHKYALSDTPFKIGDTVYFGIRNLVKTGGNFSLCFFKADNTEITPRLNATITSPISYLTKEIPAETSRIEIRLHGSTMTSCSGGKAYLSTVPFDENTVWAN